MEITFDIQRDNKLIAGGSRFFCNACCGANPLDDQSPDPRYCQGCYGVLVAEAEILTDKGFTGRPWWWPVAQKGVEKEKIPTTPPPIIMQTVNDQKSEVRIIKPTVRKVTRQKRGPKQKDLPIELITQWGGEGMGLKAIVARLKVEQGIKVHYSTVSRILSGQRVLV